MSSEEDNARALLKEMQVRCAEGPHVALGLPNQATPTEIHSAFLQLTKTFHPARFGRMAVEIQRLSNEVFLALKAAHDSLAKPKAQPQPAAPPGRRSSTSNAPPLNRPSTRPFGVPAIGRPQTPPHGNRPDAAPQRPSSGIPAPTQAIPTTRQATGPIPTVPRSTSHGTQPPPNRTATPVAPAKRPSSPPPQQRHPTTGIKFVSPTAPARGTSATPAATGPTRPSSTNPALDPQLAPILELIGREQWDQAQQVIDKLVARNPAEKRYLAFAAYTRGRRAQLAQNMGDARVELSQAVALDPDLELAKTALNELFGRRK